MKQKVSKFISSPFLCKKIHIALKFIYIMVKINLNFKILSFIFKTVTISLQIMQNVFIYDES